MRRSSGRRRRRALQLVAASLAVIGASRTVGTSPSIRVVFPKDGEWAPSWEPIDVKYALLDIAELTAGSSAAYVKCFSVDGRKKACTPLAENSRIILSGIDPGGWHNLTTTLEKSREGLDDGSGFGGSGGGPLFVSGRTTSFFGAYSESDPWGEGLELNMLAITAGTDVYGGCLAGRTCDDAAALRQTFFDHVYDYDVWSRYAPGAPSSGSGSSVEITARIRRALEEVIRWGAVKSILDAPCGDMTWMRHVDLGDASYLGVDVSAVVIERNRRQFPALEDDQKREGNSGGGGGGGGGGESGGQNHGRFTFARLDLVGGEWPRGYDLVFVRDLMYHQTPAANLAVIDNVERSGARLAMMSTHIVADENRNNYLLAQGHRINLLRPPYCLRPPEQLYREEVDTDRYMGVWELEPGRPLRDPAAPWCA